MNAITKLQILEQLEKFRHIKGKIVTVHTSLKAVGEIEGGGETLLDALIEFFACDGGLLCVPTHTWNSLVFDRRKAESCIGVLPRLAAAHPDGIRTLHPTHSMVVFGDKKLAEGFVENEAIVDTPANPKGCYGKLLAQDGYVLLIGVGQNKNTFIHCVEEMLDVPDRLTKDVVERTVIHKDGREEKRYLHWFDNKIPDVSVYFHKFEAPFRFFGCIEDAFIGNAKVQICRAGKMKDVIELIYKNNNFGELLDNDLPINEDLYKNGEMF
jgi:aminoglycoside 3-N-acetyltransferase